MSRVVDLVERIGAEEPEVLVIGDLILDDWWHGGSDRLSREAPVPVVEAAGHELAPGGAANTAMALAALGARVRLLGLVGDDSAADSLLGLLTQGGVDVSAVVRGSGVSTTRKTRIVAGDSVVVRVDERSRAGIPDAVVERLRRVAAEALSSGRTDAQLICDYGLGAATAVRELIQQAPRPRLRVVDAHDPGAWVALRPDVATPNAAEALTLLAPEEAARCRVAEDFAERGDALLRAANSSVLVVTLAGEGSLTLRSGSRAPHRTTTHPASERCTCGAGDTFTAALTAALAVGADSAAAADVAQAAADVVTAQPGTTVCSAAELLRRHAGAALDLVRARSVVEAARAAGKRIVFTNGCFDVLHRGHIVSLAEARTHGDLLVVGVNSDASVRRLKGPERPINTAQDRAAVLAALDSVDVVTVFDDDTPAALIRQLRPDVYVKGGDYSEQMLEEATIVRSYGGEVRLLGYVPDHSTTELVERIRGPRPSAPGSRRPAARWASASAPEPGRLDVLVPTRDRPAELAVTLAGLAAQDEPAFRVIVSDQSDGEPDWKHPAAEAMVRVLRAQGHPVLCDRNLPRLGLAHQRQHLLDLSVQTAPDAARVLFLDDDIWLEPGQLASLGAALDEYGGGFVGAAAQGLSYLSDERPGEERAFEPWRGPVRPEHIRMGEPGYERWPLHNAANLAHLAARLGIAPGERLAYKVAWVGGCVMFDRAALLESGGFDFWRDLPPEHAGEDVVAQWRVMDRVGGAGILPSGAVHLESPTTVVDRTADATTDRRVDMAAPNPIQVQKFLSGLDYPAGKQDIIESAKKEGADDLVLDALGRIPDGEYDAPTAVSKAVGAEA